VIFTKNTSAQSATASISAIPTQGPAAESH